MAYTPLRISVPEPCHESWDGMSPVEGTTARHCDSCAKNVVDFTGFSDAQLHAYTKDGGAKICGRFRPDQLGRQLRGTHKPSYTPLKVAATAAGMLFGSAGLDAQNTAPEPLTPTPIEVDHPEIMGEIATMPFPPAIDTVPVNTHQPDTLKPNPPMIMGRIAVPLPQSTPEISTPVDSTVSNTLPTVEVTGYPVLGKIDISHGLLSPEDPAVQDSIPTITPPEEIMGDIAIVEPADSIPGNCSPAPINEGDEVIVHPPVTGKILVDTVPAPPPELVPHRPDPAIMGLVYIEPPAPTGFDWVRDTIVDTFSKPDPAPSPPTLHPRQRPLTPRYLDDAVISPNPMVRNLRIQLDAPASELLTVELIDATGQSLYTQPWPVLEGHNDLTIKPQMARKHGIVFVRITDAAGGRVTRPIVVK